jgi:TPR repeat protein
MKPAAPLNTAIAAGLGCALALTFSPVVAPEQEHKDGITAYQAGDYNRAFAILRAEAEEGDTSAQYLLGTLYRTGQGTTRDEYAAFNWYKLAAEDGLLEAQYQLGMMYLQGEGVTARNEEAMKWLWHAAARGYPQAGEILEYVLNNDFSYGC